MLTLSKSSVVARIYRWFYATKYMPTSLVTYLTRLLIMFIFILPYSLICLPHTLMFMNDKDYVKTTFLERLGGGIALYMITFIAFSMLSALSFLFIYTWQEFTPMWAISHLGISIWLLLIGFISFQFMINQYAKYRYRHPRRKSIWDIPKPKKTYEPKINWINEKNR